MNTFPHTRSWMSNTLSALDNSHASTWMDMMPELAVQDTLHVAADPVLVAVAADPVLVAVPDSLNTGPVDISSTSTGFNPGCPGTFLDINSYFQVSILAVLAYLESKILVRLIWKLKRLLLKSLHFTVLHRLKAIWYLLHLSSWLGQFKISLNVYCMLLYCILAVTIPGSMMRRHRLKFLEPVRQQQGFLLLTDMFVLQTSFCRILDEPALVITKVHMFFLLIRYDYRYDLILGRDFLRGIGLKLDFGANTIEWSPIVYSMQSSSLVGGVTPSKRERRRERWIVYEFRTFRYGFQIFGRLKRGIYPILTVARRPGCDFLSRVLLSWHVVTTFSCACNAYRTYNFFRIPAVSCDGLYSWKTYILFYSQSRKSIGWCFTHWFFGEGEHRRRSC